MPPAPAKGVTRRTLLTAGVLGGSALLVPGALRRAGIVGSATSDQLDIAPSPIGPPFQRDLPIPRTIDPVSRDATTDFYEITARPTTTEIIDGLTTPIWGYVGPNAPQSFALPVIRARSGRAIHAKITNALPPGGDTSTLITPFPAHSDNHVAIPDGITVHLHGLNGASEFDGYPEDRFRPGESFTYEWPNNSYQRPATLWFHDHSILLTGPNVYRGMKGLYLLTDEYEDSLPLPKGEYDVPLVIQDVIIDKSGVLVYANGDGHNGISGDVLTVNGVQQPRFGVAARKYRFRILNGSDHRQYRLALSDRSPFQVIGSDHGLLAAPEPATSLLIAPAERYEIVIDFSRYSVGKTVVLENLLPGAEAGRGTDGGFPSTRQVMRFDVDRTAPDDSRVPAVLRPDPPTPPVSQAVRRRTWEFNRSGGEWTINGKEWDGNRVDARPVLGTTEIWTMKNSSGGWTHPPHIHLVRFKILAKKETRLQPGESGWKDVVLLGPNEEATLIMQFENFRGKYPIHCHNVSHEDQDMMTQFETV